MFSENWYLFLLIIMLVFASDGAFSSTEIAVLISILFALTLTAGCSDDSTATNCFCNHSVT